jgi:hypothetical protein
VGTMKTLIETNLQLAAEGRWDLDYHLPPEIIRQYPEASVGTVSELARVSKEMRDPTGHPEESFSYVDISSVDVGAGVIGTATNILGEEAPSRARMSIRAYDVLVSTVRPTRGAIAVVPVELHGQICSTGFVVLRCKAGVNPFFLHFVLRLRSTAEQFRKFATGSSYPAILDSDVLKTLVPRLSQADQDDLAGFTNEALLEREQIVAEAELRFQEMADRADMVLRGTEKLPVRPDASRNVATSVLEEELMALLDKDELACG